MRMQYWRRAGEEEQKPFLPAVAEAVALEVGRGKRSRTLCLPLTTLPTSYPQLQIWQRCRRQAGKGAAGTLSAPAIEAAVLKAVDGGGTGHPAHPCSPQVLVALKVGRGRSHWSCCCPPAAKAVALEAGRRRRIRSPCCPFLPLRCPPPWHVVFHLSRLAG